MKDKIFEESLDDLIKSSRNPRKRQDRRADGFKKDKNIRNTRIRKPDNRKKANPKTIKEDKERLPKNKEHALLVFNLPHSIKIEELQTLFKQFGAIEKINPYWIPQLKNSFNAKAFYKTEEECQKAIQFFQGAELDGNVLKAKLN